MNDVVDRKQQIADNLKALFNQRDSVTTIIKFKQTPLTILHARFNYKLALHSCIFLLIQLVANSIPGKA